MSRLPVATGITANGHHAMLAPLIVYPVKTDCLIMMFLNGAFC